MYSFADYKFYTEEYKGQMKEKDFDRFIVQASQYIRYITLGRTNTYQGDELKYATCEVAEVYRNCEGSRKQSENNDGYSVTFVNDGNTGETTEQLRDRKAYQVARKWLLNTGLLSRKVECCHDSQCRYNSL